MVKNQQSIGYYIDLLIVIVSCSRNKDELSIGAEEKKKMTYKKIIYKRKDYIFFKDFCEMFILADLK